jgi:DNA-binding XRE family transcriptional regulator/mannose-6-phosphate isomerase-like protein (cupin superfamily)
MGNDPEQSEPELAILGQRLRALRSARGWTLEELAERSGLSKPFLSRLESGSRQPSIAAVLTLARVYGVPMGSLFESQRDDDCIVVRAKDAPVRHGDGVSYVPMSTASRFNLEPIWLVVSASRQGTERYQHEGEEWVYVLSGRLRLLLGEKQHVIEAGDAAHFDARLPHRLEAMDDRDVSIVLVACPVPIALNPRRETAELAAGLVG